MSFHYSGDNSYLIVNGKEIYKFKARNKNVNFPTQIWLGSISNKFDYYLIRYLINLNVSQKKYYLREMFIFFL